MLEILTIIKEIGESGAVNYTVNGNLPLDEAAKALVIVAFNAEKPEKEENKSDVMELDSP